MPRTRPHVLVVDHDSDAARGLAAALRDEGYEPLWVRDGESALNALEVGRIECLVAVARAPRIDGLAVLRHALERQPGVCAVLIVESAGADAAIEALRLGAYDVQTRPLHRARLFSVFERGLEHQRLAAKVGAMEARLDERFGLASLVGESRAMRRVIEQVRLLAPTRANVLIEGEPGTGRDLVAQILHQSGPRRRAPLRRFACDATPEVLHESELFGVDASASRDAPESRPGALEGADGGTLLLDRVEMLSPEAQVRLLRFVQERTFTHVGGTTPRRADVRIIATAREDLAAEVAAGRFRADLDQRLGAARIPLPPLRERREDIPLLAAHFVREVEPRHRRRVTGITRGALDALMRADWPGNVRTLRSVIADAALSVRERRPLDLSDLPAALRERAGPPETLAVAVGMTLDEVERHLLAATLRHAGGDKVKAARMLGIGLRTLYRKVQRYGLVEPATRPARKRPAASSRP